MAPYVVDHWWQYRNGSESVHVREGVAATTREEAFEKIKSKYAEFIKVAEEQGESRFMMMASKLEIPGYQIILEKITQED